MAKKAIQTYEIGSVNGAKVLGVDGSNQTKLFDCADIMSLAENKVPQDQRLDENQSLGVDSASNKFYPFQKAVVTVVDDHVECTYQSGMQGWCGVRNDYIPTLLDSSKKYNATFWYKTNKMGAFWWNSSQSHSYNLPNTNGEWVQMKIEITNVARIQFSNNSNDGAAPQGWYLHVKDLAIIDASIADLGSRLTEVENGINALNDNYFKGKKLSILGDSISTCSTNNAVSFKVTQNDIDNSVSLIGYPTKYDIGKIIGSVEVTSEMVGVETTFTPTAGDLNKTIGEPLNYNSLAEAKLWWKITAEKLGMTVLANVSWSGASISSHEGNKADYIGSYAHHASQIAKIAQRDNNGVLQTPDVVVIYRGTNDFSHTPYSKLGTFSNESTSIPESDSDGNDYFYKDALAMTINAIRNTYPDADIFVCTLNIFKRITYDHFPTRNGINTLPQFNNAIREVADAMGCGIIEFDKDGITFENCYTGGYITDSATTPTHPNEKGHAQMAKKAIADMLRHISK